MLLRSEDKHLSLAEDGQIFWQDDPSNPLPGVPLGRVVKGDAPLSPKVEGQGDAQTNEKLQTLFDLNLKLALQPLFNLVEGDDLNDQAKEICQKLHEAMGVLARDEVQVLVNGMDEEGRNALRKRKIRMGPLLIFLPELNKPAAVKLKAFLLSLWNDKALPAEAPADGMVSFAVGDKVLDQDYYRMIGYPIYGPRVIRVDMLDRVVCAVYDLAKDGEFQAQHQMAEWLGSNIPDLYDVLEAMGHKKISDPLQEAVEEENAVSEEKTEEVQEAKTEETAEEKPQEKPVLATFKLKRGSAISRPVPKKENKKFDDKKDKKEKPKFNKKKKKDGFKPKGERVYVAEAKQEDSPFAVLEQLKK